MGNCQSGVDAELESQRARSQAIDKQIEVDAKRVKKEIKILLLGSSESGKSTIVKQMKIIHQDGFSPEELLAYRMTIWRNLLESAQAIVLYIRKLQLDCVYPANTRNVERISSYQIEPHEDFLFDEEVAEAIYELWEDPVTVNVLNHSSEFYLMDNAVYFFREAKRIGVGDYVPNETDVLRARRRSTSILEMRFDMGPLSIHMFDVGGQRSERKKWIQCFESVTSIIFCAALSEYDQVLYEDRSKNRMQESLELFDSLVNSRWFLRTSIILFLNKIDLFKTKLPKSPMKMHFPEYSGGPDIEKAQKFVYYKFSKLNRASLVVYPHVTQATNTRNIRHVFAAVRETLLQNALKDAGVL